MKTIIAILALCVFGLFGCSGGGVNDAFQQSAISSASYMICKQNPEAIPAMKAVCMASDDQLGVELVKLYAKYDSAIEDPFLKMQADILLEALMDEYGFDLLNPNIDLAEVTGEELRPFVDYVCVGVAAAEGM